MYIAKLHKQHSSVVMTVPVAIRKKLGVCAGDFVGLDDCSEFPGNNMVCMQKVELQNVRDKRNSNRKN